MDQLIIFMALASGKSRVLTGPLSLHTETAIHFAKLLTGATFTVEESPVRQGLFEVQCEGIAYEPPTASRE
jgi:RNA 3'-terminal phosphate cyclase (ATP)